MEGLISCAGSGPFSHGIGDRDAKPGRRASEPAAAYLKTRLGLHNRRNHRAPSRSACTIAAIIAHLRALAYTRPAYKRPRARAGPRASAAARQLARGSLRKHSAGEVFGWPPPLQHPPAPSRLVRPVGGEVIGSRPRVNLQPARTRGYIRPQRAHDRYHPLRANAPAPATGCSAAYHQRAEMKTAVLLALLGCLLAGASLHRGTSIMAAARSARARPAPAPVHPPRFPPAPRPAQRKRPRSLTSPPPPLLLQAPRQRTTASCTRPPSSR
jgi:hypothetical protein